MGEKLPPNLDVSLFSYEQWLKFFFEQRLLGADESFWSEFLEEGVYLEVGQPARAVEHVTRMCLEFRELGQRYSLAQIDQGIWAILGGGSSLAHSLWKREVPLATHLACVRAMYHPFADFVAGHPVDAMENCFDMWWDLVALDFWCQRSGLHELYSSGMNRGAIRQGLKDLAENRHDLGRLTGDDLTLFNQIFETLCAILRLDDRRCQQYALHGLGHLHHPGVADVVQHYMDAHRHEATPEFMAWMERCRDGCVM